MNSPRIEGARSWYWVVGLVLSVLMVLVVYVRTWTIDLPYPSSVATLEQRGQFGDSFGIVSALASSMGFIGILFTLFMQQSQISLQSERDEESRKKDELENYEKLLFKLLDLYMQSVDEIRIVYGAKSYVGRSALSLLLENMQHELKRRKLNFLPPKIMDAVKSGNPNTENKLVFDYVSSETCRVIQYKVVYQRRMVASLRTLLNHLEHRCPEFSNIDTYRGVVAAQVTHTEIQYVFAIVLIYANESELRELLHKSNFFSRDSAPYNFKLHQFLYKHFWGVTVGDRLQARKLAFTKKQNEAIRLEAKREPLASLLQKLRISEPIDSSVFGMPGSGVIGPVRDIRVDPSASDGDADNSRSHSV